MVSLLTGDMQSAPSYDQIFIVPYLAAPLNGLADLYQEQQKYAQAEPLYERARLILERALGPEHPDLATLLSGLADLYANQRKDKQAEQFNGTK